MVNMEEPMDGLRPSSKRHTYLPVCPQIPADQQYKLLGLFLWGSYPDCSKAEQGGN